LENYQVTERHACRLLGQWRGTQRYEGIARADEDQLTQAILVLASEYGRYGYRRITVKLREAGWPVGKDRVQRIWQREGLKVPQKHRPREGCGSTIARACGCDPSVPIRCVAPTS
jgi:putative transposase